MNMYEIKQLSDVKVIDKDAILIGENKDKISVKKGSEIFVCAAFNDTQKMVHLGIIAKNEWILNDKTKREFLVAHLLHKKDWGSYIRVQLCDTINEACGYIESPIKGDSGNVISDYYSIGTSNVGFHELLELLPIVCKKSVKFEKETRNCFLCSFRMTISCPVCERTTNCLNFLEKFSVSFKLNFSKQELMTRLSNKIGSANVEDLKKKFGYA